ncbi:divalent metal cation transporter [Sphingomonas sp.]|uniref:NRAMP family divalent metal transporter n=1 Tax=Sphingomonas sp. TaxID=28214 RepID=UPI0025FC14E6|nr:divalent metal cation transporter [Sphingomonas sp.]
MTNYSDTHDGSAQGPQRLQLRDVVGPGLVSGASDDDPSGIATYSQAGAQFGYALGWTMLVTYPLMSAVQMISGRIGRVTGHGIAGNLRRHYPAWLTYAAVSLLLIANTINIGADLGAMADATALVAGVPAWPFLILFAAFCALTEVFTRYASYVRHLKWLTLALLAYVVTLFLIHVSWGEALRGVAVPLVNFNAATLTMIVAIFGTTISPYVFFWEAEGEAEDVHVLPERHPLDHAPREGPSELKRIELDTLAGMGGANLVALAIIFTAAATLHAHGITDIDTSADAAEALRPITGPYASTVFALGIVGTGLLAVPVLAGSAAYAIGEALQWKVGLDRKPKRAKAFYGTIVAATGVGALMNFTPINPIDALYMAAVINGVVSVPVLAVMMLMAQSRSVMGRFIIRGRLKLMGWLAAAVMALAVVAMGATSLG